MLAFTAPTRGARELQTKGGEEILKSMQECLKVMQECAKGVEKLRERKDHPRPVKGERCLLGVPAEGSHP